MTTHREVIQQALDLLNQGVSVWPGTSMHEDLRSALAEQEPVDIGPEWTPCVKLPVTVHVRQQRPGETHVSTREGITPVKPDDLIMRGVSGEEYPIGREIFERTYQLGEAQPTAEPQKAGSLAELRDMLRAEVDRLIAAPQPRKRLTLEEIDRALDLAGVPELPAGYESVEIAIARAVEAAVWGDGK